MYQLRNSIYVVDHDLYVMDDQGNLVNVDFVWCELIYSIYEVLV